MLRFLRIKYCLYCAFYFVCVGKYWFENQITKHQFQGCQLRIYQTWLSRTIDRVSIATNNKSRFSELSTPILFCRQLTTNDESNWNYGDILALIGNDYFIWIFTPFHFMVEDWISLYNWNNCPILSVKLIIIADLWQCLLSDFHCI